MSTDTMFKGGRFIAVFAVMIMALASFAVLTIAEENDAADEMCTITFETNGGSAIEPIEVKKGTCLFYALDGITEPVKTDVDFFGWYDKSLNNVYPDTFIVNKNITLYAKWWNMETECIVEFFAGSGSINSHEIQVIVEKNKTVTAPRAPELDGMRFTGWYSIEVDPDTGEPNFVKFDFSQKIEDSMFLFAGYEEQTFFGGILDFFSGNILACSLLFVAFIACIAYAIGIRHPLVIALALILAVIALVILIMQKNGITLF